MTRLLIPDVSGLPRAFWLLFASALVDRLGGFGIVYLAIWLAGPDAPVGLSVASAGLAMSAFSVAGIVGGPVGGALADRFGRKPVLVGGLLGTAASYLLLGQMSTLVGIAGATGLVGLSVNLARPAMTAAIADVVPEEHRRRAFGLHYWAINLGFAFSAAAAGGLAPLGPALVFGLDAATSVLAALLLVIAMRDAPRAGAAHARASVAELLTGPAKDGLMMLVVLVGFMNASMFHQASVVLAAEMRVDGLASAYGPLLAINGVLIVFLQPTLTQVTTRFRAHHVMATGCLLVGCGFFSTAFADGAPAHGAAIAVWTLGEILLAATVPTVITRLAPEAMRASYQGLYGMAWSVSAFAPALGAWVSARGHSELVWGACLALGLVGVGVQRFIGRSPRMA
ncbi:MAG: MFS transporter [Deltaproteobacteria bacterium]|nr:MFS transporter [Deltaproteobacteria bacterium]